MKKLLLPLLLLLTSCFNMGSSSQEPALSFRRYQPIYMHVSRIEVVEEYQSPLRAPNVEHLMPYSPADAMQIWSKQRLKASGGDKTMQVIIKDASVVDSSGGASDGWFGLGAAREYQARLEVEIRVYGDSALSEASVNVVGTRMLKVLASASLNERNAKFREMIKEMMTTANAELEKNIHQYLSNYVDYAKNP